MIGIEDFVIAEIQKMLDNDRYVERFKEILKDKLICLERETESAYPALKKKLKDLDAEISKTQDALIFTGSRSQSLADRLLESEESRERLKKELVKYENIKQQPSKVLLLVNEYSRALKKAGDILKGRTPGEQKTSIGYFLDRIEILREEGVARCYFFDTPRPREIDYILPGYEPERVCTSIWCRRGDSNPHRIAPTAP